MGKTKRNHPKNSAPKQYNTIQFIKPFMSRDGENWKGQKIVEKEFGIDISSSVPQDIIWAITSYKMLGLQDLANFLDKKVHLVIENQNHWDLPVAVLTDKYNYSGGPFLSYIHTKSHPKTVAFIPKFTPETVSFQGRETESLRDALEAYDGVQITLRPHSKHYIFHCE
jgi:hypothetical protein